MNKKILITVGLLGSLAFAQEIGKAYDMPNTGIINPNAFYFDSITTEGHFPLTDIQQKEGGWSDLVRDMRYPDRLVFWSINDRGLNIGHELNGRADKVFPTPNYHQKRIQVEFKNNQVTVLKLDSLKDSCGVSTTGLPNPIFPPDEVALQGSLTDDLIDTTHIIAKDLLGFDLEGIGMGLDGSFWFSEEYGPSILHTNKAGQIIRNYIPGNGLPKVIGKRRSNRGLEGLAVTPAGKIVSIMQSPLYNTKKASKPSDTKNKSHAIRIVMLDPENGETKEYAYRLDTKSGVRKIGDTKIGAITAVNDSVFLVVEQGIDGVGKFWTDIYKTTITSTTTNITLVGDTIGYGTLYKNNTVTFEEFAYDTTIFASLVIPVKKELWIGDIQTNYPEWKFEKLEGISLINDSTIALVNDNDFGFREMSPFGYVDGLPHIQFAEMGRSVMMFLNGSALTDYQPLPIKPIVVPDVQYIDEGHHFAFVRYEGETYIVTDGKLPGKLYLKVYNDNHDIEFTSVVITKEKAFKIDKAWMDSFLPTYVKVRFGSFEKIFTVPK